MKVLLVGKPWRGMWLEYVRHAFEELGHDTLVFHTTGNNTLDRLTRRIGKKGFTGLWRQRWTSGLSICIDDFRPDLILVVSALIEDEMLQFLCENKQLAKLFAWFGDDPSSRPYRFEWLDHGFVTDTSHLNALQQIGVSGVSYLPFAASPHHHFPESTAEEPSSDIVFVVGWSPEREEMISVLSERRIGIFGPNWKRSKNRALRSLANSSFLSIPQWRRLYSNAALSLNVHQNVCKSGTNMRTYEIPACGGCALVEWKDDLKLDFDMDKEILVFRGKDDLKEKVDFALENSKRRKKLQQQGRARVLSEHTYIHRVTAILNRL